MTPDDLIPAIHAIVPDAKLVTAAGDVFFMHPDDPNLPLATIVTGDNDWDNASNLARDGVLRVNVGIDRDAFRDLFGDLPKWREPQDAGIDFTRLDVLMPHPMYARLYWISVLNPSLETLRSLRPQLELAFRLAAARVARKQAG